MEPSKDYNILFKVKLGDLVNDLMNNFSVNFNNEKHFKQLLYDNRELYYQALGNEEYNPISLASIVSNSKVQSLAVEILNEDLYKGDIISVKQSKYSSRIDYVAVMRRTIQGLDDVGLLFDLFNTKKY